LIDEELFMRCSVKVAALILANALVYGLVPVVSARTGVPAGGGASGTATGLAGNNPGAAARENNSGGTAPAPVYSGPAAQAGANSPPVNSGITDPKTGANNDTRPPSGASQSNGGGQTGNGNEY
jgi:hypothetical protein